MPAPASAAAGGLAGHPSALVDHPLGSLAPLASCCLQIAPDIAPHCTVVALMARACRRVQPPAAPLDSTRLGSPPARTTAPPPLHLPITCSFRGSCAHPHPPPTQILTKAYKEGIQRWNKSGLVSARESARENPCPPPRHRRRRMRHSPLPILPAGLRLRTLLLRDP